LCLEWQLGRAETPDLLIVLSQNIKNDANTRTPGTSASVSVGASRLRIYVPSPNPSLALLGGKYSTPCKEEVQTKRETANFLSKFVVFCVPLTKNAPGSACGTTFFGFLRYELSVNWTGPAFFTIIIADRLAVK